MFSGANPRAEVLAHRLERNPFGGERSLARSEVSLDLRERRRPRVEFGRAPIGAVELAPRGSLSDLGIRHETLRLSDRSVRSLALVRRRLGGFAMQAARLRQVSKGGARCRRIGNGSD
jgi:hypothetical protein